MRGLTVRWSLAGTAPEVGRQLADYVAETSHARFSSMPGLAYKTWRSRPGEWFEGCYVFETAADRARFQNEFTEVAEQAPGSQIIGRGPELIEACEVVAVAEGGAGFSPSPRG